MSTIGTGPDQGTLRVGALPLADMLVLAVLGAYPLRCLVLSVTLPTVASAAQGGNGIRAHAAVPVGRGSS